MIALKSTPVAHSGAKPTPVTRGGLTLIAQKPTPVAHSGGKPTPVAQKPTLGTCSDGKPTPVAQKPTVGTRSDGKPTPVTPSPRRWPASVESSLRSHYGLLRDLKDGTLVPCLVLLLHHESLRTSGIPIPHQRSWPGRSGHHGPNYIHLYAPYTGYECPHVSFTAAQLCFFTIVLCEIILYKSQYVEMMFSW